ncbi:unannotated protein [freshwater metagenome]|uniref:Unannotated protein n=1 Tax=freshwater metagenome TaxID=449393 RepID=A0A6J6PZR8_9ZZZZ
MFSVAARAVLATGAKVTSMAHVANGAMAPVVQFCDATVKSAAPVIVVADTSAARLPMFLMTADWAGDVLFTARVPKSRLAGLAMSTATDWPAVSA